MLSYISLVNGARAIERRRAHRVNLNAPVFLYGSTNGGPFSEYSETVDVSVNGTLVAVNAHLIPKQRILLTNLQTEEDTMSHCPYRPPQDRRRIGISGVLFALLAHRLRFGLGIRLA